MKLLKPISILLSAILLCACSPPDEPETKSEVYFTPIESCSLFPFYFIDGSGNLCRCDNGIIREVGKNALYLSGESKESFVHYFEKSDTVIFASDIVLSSGEVICKLFVQSGKNSPQLLHGSVLFDSIKIGGGNSVIFMSSDSTLYLKDASSLLTVENNVLRAVFADNGTLLYLQKESNGETSVYSYFSGIKTYLTDGEDIISANDGAYIVKNTKRVQQRAFSAEVATFLFFKDGELLCDIPSVPISRFDGNESSDMLLSLDETSAKPRYNLFCVNSAEQNNKIMPIAENVIDGKSITDGIYVFECEENSATVTYIYQNGSLTNIGTVPIGNIHAVNGNLYVFNSGNITSLKTGEKIFTDIKHAEFGKNYITVTTDENPPYSAVLFTSKSTYRIKNLSLMQGILCDGAFYFFSENSFDLMRFDTKTLDITALVAETDIPAGILADSDFIIASKGGSLFIAGQTFSLDTGVTVTQIITDSEVSD